MGLIELAIMAVMVVFNGVFAGYEIALAAVTVARLQVLVGENRAGAKAALYMKQNIEASLAAMQVAMTLLAAIAAAIGGVGAAESITALLPGALGLSHAVADGPGHRRGGLPLTLFTILFGELMPKVFSLRNKEWVCLRLSPLMRWFCFSVWPAVWLFETCVTDDDGLERAALAAANRSGGKSEAIELLELRAQAASARASRLIGEREEGIILGAARLSSRTVARNHAARRAHQHVGRQSSLSESLVTAHLDMHTRFPVAERAGDPQSILGYVNFKDLVALMRLSQPHEASLRAILAALAQPGRRPELTACLERTDPRAHAHRPGARRRRQDGRHDYAGRHPRRTCRRDPGRIRPAAGPCGAGRLGLGRRRRDRPAAAKELTGIDLAADPPEQTPPEGVRTFSDWIIAHSRRTVP